MEQMESQRLREDAERNRQRIIEAAHDLFRRRGLSATLHDVARRAGVGGATVYRHFPKKEQLVDALLDEHADEWGLSFGEDIADRDPWRALTSVYESVLDAWARNRALREIFLGPPYASEHIETQRARLRALLATLIGRVREAGGLRAGVTTQDFDVVLIMLAAVMNAAEDASPELWRRYLPVVLRGLRPQGAPLEETFE